MLKGIHHIAIIVSDYGKSKHFYTKILGLEIITENFRKERNSYKLDLSVNGIDRIELFSFPSPPPRPSYPEATGLRHFAFSVSDINDFVKTLSEHNILCEPIRIDEFTGKQFTFFRDPDQLPIEIYEL